MKTFILTIFGLLALANAQGDSELELTKAKRDANDGGVDPRANAQFYRRSPRAWDLQEEDVYGGYYGRKLTKAYADPGYEQPAYADPGYEQPAKYVQFKLNYSGISCSILFA